MVLLLAASWLGFGRLTLTPQGAPFLLARSWEDGPARAYLEAACPEAGWAICPQVGRLAGTAQEFLWRPDDSYWSMDLATRAAVRAEEPAILLRALAARSVAAGDGRAGQWRRCSSASSGWTTSCSAAAPR